MVLDWFWYVGDGCGLVFECFWNGCGSFFVVWEWFGIKLGMSLESLWNRSALL